MGGAKPHDGKSGVDARPSDCAAETLEALARCSRGVCYYPGRPEPVVGEVNGETRLIVEVATIRGVSPESPRYDSAMTEVSVGTFGTCCFCVINIVAKLMRGRSSIP